MLKNVTTLKKEIVGNYFIIFDNFPIIWFELIKRTFVDKSYLKHQKIIKDFFIETSIEGRNLSAMPGIKIFFHSINKCIYNKIKYIQFIAMIDNEGIIKRILINHYK